MRTQVDRTVARRRWNVRSRRPSLELLEPRQLLSDGFVQGFALDNSNHPVVGATVELLNGSNTVVQSTTTNSDGYYGFNNVVPGTYNVTELATNYSTGVTGSDIQTTINPASVIDSGTEIQVTVLDPSQQSIGLTWTGGFAGDTVDVQLNASTYNLAGAPQNTGSEYEGQLQISSQANLGNIDSFYSFCSDLIQGVYANAPTRSSPA